MKSLSLEMNGKNGKLVTFGIDSNRTQYENFLQLNQIYDPQILFKLKRKFSTATTDVLRNSSCLFFRQQKQTTILLGG